MDEEILILGAGGLAREVAFLIEANRALGAGQRVVGFVDHEESPQVGTVLNGYPVMTLAAARQCFPAARAVTAVGNPQIRRRLVDQACGAKLEFATVIHRGVALSPTSSVGPGTVICMNTVITVNVTIGSHVYINLSCTVGHDTIIENFVTINPGSNVSGGVYLNSDVQLGTNCSIINGVPDRFLNIGQGAIVGAGACVLRNVAAGDTVVGVPARSTSHPGK